MRTAYFVKAIIFSLLLWSISYKVFANNVSEQHCRYYYETLKDLNALICSNEKITTTEMNNLRNSIEKTYRLYPKFIEKYIKSNNHSSERYLISIMTAQEINTPGLFNLTCESEKVILARYFPVHRLVYVTKNAFKLGNLDIPHEITHYLNEMNDIVDVDKDEEIAYAFEKYYSSAMP